MFFISLQILEKQVSQNGEQPVFGLGPVLELGEILDGIVKGFLCQVFGVMRFTGQAAGAPEDEVHMREQKFVDLRGMRAFNQFLLNLVE